MNTFNEEYVTTNEFARLLGVSVPWFRQIQRGNFKGPKPPEPAVKMSKLYLWKKEDAEAYAEKYRRYKERMNHWEASES
ncbi:hypothetical protein CVV65_13575 [Kyrpidia spormannii]|uniref:DNA-binding protein n=1 Tax=Kyrpidia spormannii TaxID=2055160 RepID=A0A2K8N920_9BACL|nr:hypothetical protein CVV65_13575 [Kyrpidia spormannii]